MVEEPKRVQNLDVTRLHLSRVATFSSFYFLFGSYRNLRGASCLCRLKAQLSVSGVMQRVKTLLFAVLEAAIPDRGFAVSSHTSFTIGVVGRLTCYKSVLFEFKRQISAKLFQILWSRG